MYLLIINLYELGQFLRILLWIALPASIVWTLVTTFLQYRRSWREQSGLRLAIEGGQVLTGRGLADMFRGLADIVRGRMHMARRRAVRMARRVRQMK